jgi:hypothetical protein
MENLNELYKGTIYSLYEQILLLDNETTYDHVRMRTGSESVAFGPYGVVVAAKGDQKIEVIVLQGEGEPKHKLCVTGQISVGNKGLLVGNVVAADTATFNWPKGRTLVTVYTNGIDIETTIIYFYLEYLGEY